MQFDAFFSIYESDEYAAILAAAKKAGLSRPDAYYIDGAWHVTAGALRTMYNVIGTGNGYAFAR